jgi:PAS domain-containing protein
LKTLTSFYEAPFYHEDELIAYLVLGAEGKDAYTENQIQLLDIVANQSSVLLKRLRDLLSSEKTRLEQLVESLPQALLLLDKDWRIVIKNPVAEDLLALVFGDSIPEVLSDIGGLSRGHRSEGLRQSAARRWSRSVRTEPLVTSVPVRKGPESGHDPFYPGLTLNGNKKPSS